MTRMPLDAAQLARRALATYLETTAGVDFTDSGAATSWREPFMLSWQIREPELYDSIWRRLMVLDLARRDLGPRRRHASMTEAQVSRKVLALYMAAGGEVDFRDSGSTHPKRRAKSFSLSYMILEPTRYAEIRRRAIASLHGRSTSPPRD